MKRSSKNKRINETRPNSVLRKKPASVKASFTNNFKKKEKRRTESMQKKINDTIKQQKRIYENDQKHYQEIQSMSMTRKMEEDKKVQIELEKFDK
mmetsp:Transcript_11076/g.11003  ORF Transcript_11076/g.11003 Transcript_11076/m.11003 type:complete len:95 (-) Transcript_11076:479-763(-)